MTAEYNKVGYCQYCGGYVDDEDDSRKRNPVVYYSDSTFSGWVCPECVDELEADNESRIDKNRRLIDENFISRIGVRKT